MRALIAALPLLSLASLGVRPARADVPGDVAKPKLVAPKLLDAPEVPYPDGASGDATVVLELQIDEKGEVASARVETGDEPFAARALEGATKFRFAPATRDGTPVRARIRYQLKFAPPPPPEVPAAEPAKVESPPSGAPTAAPAPPKPTEIEVTGAKAPPSVTSFSRAEVRELPGAFGDPFRAIESMPGVTPIVSGLPFFYVRGAPPGNVGYFLDGVRVPYLYHVGLGPSVIHPGMVDRVDLYPGGYPARFGRYAGGIVSGEATAPRSRTHGEANLRLFDAGAMVETGFANGRGTVLLGGRYSYTATILSLIAKDAVLDYRDYQARVTYDLSPRDRITAFAFGAYDLLGQKQGGATRVAFGSEFYRLDLRYDHAFARESTIRVATTLGYDQSKLGDTRNTRDRIIGGRIELSHRQSKELLLRGGMDLTTDNYTASRPLYVDPESPSAVNAEKLFPPRLDLMGGIWADVVLTAGSRVEITPGVRADIYRQGDVTRGAIDPRVSARFKINNWLKLIHAYGIAHQAPSFVVPLPGLSPATLKNGLQRAWQASAGIELTLPEDVTGTISVFHNAFFNMTDAIGSGGNGSAADDERSAGRAIGLELFLRRRLTKRLGGFISYTLSRSTRDVAGGTTFAAFDRTHVGSAALTFDLGRRWRAGSRFTFYTGIPRSNLGTSLNPAPPTLSPDRDRAFYRLDVRLEKRWQLTESARVSFVAEMLNTTLSKETISGLEIGPIAIPSIGLEGGF